MVFSSVPILKEARVTDCDRGMKLLQRIIFIQKKKKKISKRTPSWPCRVQWHQLHNQSSATAPRWGGTEAGDEMTVRTSIHWLKSIEEPHQRSGRRRAEMQ